LEPGQLLDGKIARTRAIQDLLLVVGNVPHIFGIGGATPGEAFRYVTLSLIMPGAGNVTLPLQIYSMLKIAVTPEGNAVSTLFIRLPLAFIIIASRLSPGPLGVDPRNP